MRLVTKIIAASFFVVSIPLSSNAAELNIPGFNGTITSTITTGFSARTEDNNCKGLPGYSITANTDYVSGTAATFIASGLNPTGAAWNDAILKESLTNQTNKNGAGCATSEVDGYGNTSSQPLYFGNQNSDNGKMNFPNSGDVINATSKMLTEIRGYTDEGTGINLSFIGSVNPVLDINGPQFIQLTSDAKAELENDITLIDAYLTHSIDTPGGGYVDLSIGRLATSYGEATFLPIGMNGLVTAGIDLSKLRNPGASIKDAIIPTEQVVASFQAGDWGVEAYYQFGHDPVKLDPKGAFFGSDIVGTGAENLLASGGWKEGTYGGDQACSYAYNVLQLATRDARMANAACNLASYTVHRENRIYDTSYLARYAQVNASSSEWQTWATVGRTQDYLSAIQAGGAALGHPDPTSLPGLDMQNVLSTFSSSATGAATLASNVYTEAKVAAWDENPGATVALGFADEGKFKEPDSGNDFGFSAHKYYEDLGTGVDIGIYAANYTSKAPYAQVIGQGGVLAGDHVGMYKAQLGDYTGVSDGTIGHSSGFDVRSSTLVLPTESNMTAAGAAWLAMANGTYGSGVAGGFTAISSLFDAFRKDGGNTTDAALSTTNTYAKNYIREGLFGNGITHADGSTKVYHSPVGLVTGFNEGSGTTPFATKSTAGASATTDLAFLSYAATLLPAITPLNLAQIRFIYPENQILGASFNTNIGGTTVQGEVSYRPDFKLATNLGDQVNQIGDASGTSAALTAFAVESGQTAMETSVLFNTLETVVANVVSGTTMTDLVRDIERSSLPNLKALATSDDQEDYYSSAFVEYDTWSFDIGTTTSFSPSSNVVRSLGADSAFFLTELGAVYIAGMNDKQNGFVARNGFNEGAGEFLCLGVFQDLTDAERSTISSTMIANGYTNFNIDYNMMDVSTFNKLATSDSSHTRSGSPLAAGTPLQEGDIALGTTPVTIGAAGSGTNSLDKITKISSVTNIGASVIDALFGNGSYCESQMGADELSMTYRIIGSATYNNINNSRWSMSPNFAWAHDFYGYGPSSLGGFVPDKQSLSLGLNFDKGDGLRVGLSYVMQLGDLENNMAEDRDFVSANLSYAF